MKPGGETLNRRVYLLDLKPDAELIERYRAWHAPGSVPAAVLASIRAAGIREMEIFQAGDRLVMLMTTDPNFDPAAKAAADSADPEVQAWERMMDAFQQRLAFAAPGEKWIEAAPIFRLSDH
jgi:L-rhamnose mutarotase